MIDGDENDQYALLFIVYCLFLLFLSYHHYTNYYNPHESGFKLLVTPLLKFLYVPPGTDCTQALKDSNWYISPWQLSCLKYHQSHHHYYHNIPPLLDASPPPLSPRTTLVMPSFLGKTTPLKQTIRIKTPKIMTCLTIMTMIILAMLLTASLDKTSSRCYHRTPSQITSLVKLSPLWTNPQILTIPITMHHTTYSTTLTGIRIKQSTY